MRRFFQHGADTGIVPPKVGVACLLELVKQLDFGSRQHAKADKHKALIGQWRHRVLGSMAQLTTTGHHALAVKRLMIAMINGL